MRFIKEHLNALRKEYINEELNLIVYLFLKAKVILGNDYVDSYYYPIINQLLEIYKIGRENHIPTREEIIEERNYYFEENS